MQRFRGELWNIHRLHGSMKDRTGGDWLPLAMIKSVTLKILVWPVMMATSTVQMASVAPLQSTLQHGQHNAPRPVMADVASQAEESQSSHVVQGRKPCIIGRPTPSENYVNRASSTVRACLVPVSQTADFRHLIACMLRHTDFRKHCLTSLPSVHCLPDS